MFWAGPRWGDGATRPGWVRAEGGRILDEGEGKAPGAATAAVILEGVTDFHTHLGDAFLRGQPIPRDLAQAVAPPNGFKHRALRSATSSEIVRGMRLQLQRFAAAGTAWAVDFREQGVEGVRMGRHAVEGTGVAVEFLGRAATQTPSAADYDRVLSASDGLGLSALRDMDPNIAASAARAAHSQGKPVALHVSEAVREKVEPIVALQPDLVVHACAATKPDLRSLVDAGAALVGCPRSNHHFGLGGPPLAAYAELGGEWFLGTDNAMLGHDDVLGEARFLQASHKPLPDDEVLRALTSRPQNVFNKRGDAASNNLVPFLVLPQTSSGRVDWTAKAVVLRR